MNASMSEDSVAETALAKKNSDGKINPCTFVGEFVNDVRGILKIHDK